MCSFFEFGRLCNCPDQLNVTQVTLYPFAGLGLKKLTAYSCYYLEHLLLERQPPSKESDHPETTYCEKPQPCGETLENMTPWSQGWERERDGGAKKHQTCELRSPLGRRQFQP